MDTKKENHIAISVIVPVYNIEKYISECIESILNQDLPLEIILINDGSTDESVEIINYYAGKNSNIKVFHQKNRGLSAARNKGLQLASGKYVAFVDGDDWLKKDSLSILHQEATQQNADMIMGEIIYIYPDGKTSKPFEKKDKFNNNILLSGKKCFIELMKSDTYAPMVWNYIYKREWLIKNNFQFQDLLHEDELWTPITMCQAERVIILNYNFYFYRQHDSSIINTLKPAKRITSLFIICNQLIEFTNQNFSNDKETYSWLYLRIFWLYSIGFMNLYKIQRSNYLLPSHHLHSIFQIYDRLIHIPKLKCKQHYLEAKKDLKYYRTLRLSPWFNKLKINKNKTVILIYNTMWGDRTFSVKPEDLPEDYIITLDRSFLKTADAVVFHIPSLLQDLENDLVKPEDQLWIAWCLESKGNYPILNDEEFMSSFDLRMGYHQYDDIIYPYYTYEHLKDLCKPVSQSVKLNKCCMLISSGFNKSNQEEYLKELMNYTEIDSYGSLLKNTEIEEDKGIETKLEIYSKYKFVISFENSIEFDYVTEKFFDPLLAGSVPIYFGAPNIKEYKPGKNSFIDIRDFETPLQLAKFVNSCYKDEQLYKQFLKWKRSPLSPSLYKKIEAQKNHPFITLCKKVKDKKHDTLHQEQDINSLGNIYICGFADSRYTYSIERFRRQAEDMNIFKDMFIYSEKDLPETFIKDFSRHLNPKTKGYGYWVWKPYLIYQSLEKLKEGDVLLYTDIGCHLNYRGKTKFIDYWKTVKQNKSGFLVFQLEPDRKEKYWTKGDVLDYFNARNKLEITDSPQYQATIIFIRKNRQAMELVRKWLSIYYSDFHLIDDTPSCSPNAIGFEAHRHDQSIISIILKLNKASVLPVTEVYTSGEWGFLEKNSPILIKRDLQGLIAT